MWSLFFLQNHLSTRALLLLNNERDIIVENVTLAFTC